MKTIIVTGGSGFIGSHLCDFFIKKGFAVICVDNLVTGDCKNVEHLMQNRNFKFLQQDICQEFQIQGPVHYILDFASPASPVDFKKIPIEIMKTGSVGTMNMLELARKKKAVFMFASTSEVYGDPLVNPQPETYLGNVSCIGERSCYDEAKRFSEALVMAYNRKYGTDTKMVRIFNTYGPRMRPEDGRVIPNFVNQALRNEPITVYGQGNQTRSFCYVSDLIDGIYKLLMSKENLPVNIGNPNEMKVVDLAKKIITITNSKSKIAFKELPVDDPKQRRPDITKARRILKWEPKVSLDDGLKRTIEYFDGME